MDNYEQELQNLIYSLENDGSSSYSQYFIIDKRTRKIIVPKDFVTLGVESDADSERIWFECPRYVGDNVDLTTRNIYINYETADGERDAYYSDDVVVDGDNVHFSWKIQSKVVRYKGDVKFIVCAMSTDEEGKVISDWNTTLCTAPVLEGLEVKYPKPPEEEYNLINQLIDVTKNAISEVNSLSASSKEEIDELRLQSLADVEAEKTKSIEEVNAKKQEALEYIGSGVDNTLTKENLAADAKVTGDKIRTKASAIVCSAEGKLISIKDSAENQFIGLRIFGKSEQFTTTGKNKCPNTATTKTVNGVTFTVNEDKSVTVTGTATSNARFDLYNSTTGIPAGSYVLSGGISTQAYIAMLTSNGSSLGISSNVGSDITFSVTEEQTLKGVSIRLMVTSGATVNGTFFPMIRSASDTDNAYEPYTGGMPSPNPSYPQEIVSVGNSGSLEQFVCGENLYGGVDLRDCIRDKISGTVDDANKTVTFDAKNVNDQLLSPVGMFEENTVYTIVLYGYTKNPDGDLVSHTNCRLRYTDGTYENFQFETGYSTGAVYAVIHTGNNKSVAGLYGAYLTGSTTLYYEECGVYLGNITDFSQKEPYKRFQSLTLSTPNGLSGLPVSVNGNYTDENGQQYICDEVDLEREVYVQRVGVIDGYTNEDIKAPYISTTGQLSIGAKVLYVLPEPIETPLSEEEITAYKTLHTNYPNTTIYNDDGAYTEVKYVADTKIYLDGIFAKEIAAGDKVITLRDIHTRLVALESENAELKSALDDMIKNE